MPVEPTGRDRETARKLAGCHFSDRVLEVSYAIAAERERTIGTDAAVIEVDDEGDYIVHYKRPGVSLCGHGSTVAEALRVLFDAFDAVMDDQRERTARECASAVINGSGTLRELAHAILHRYGLEGA